MAIKFSVDFDIREVERSLSSAQRKVIPRATSQAVNRVAGTVRTRIRREIAKFMNIQQKWIKNAFTLKKGHPNQLVIQAVVKGKSRNLPLAFVKGVQGRRPKRRRGKGVGRATAAALRPITVFRKPRRLRGAFLGRTRGLVRIFTRDESNASGIRELKGPSVQQSMRKREMVNLMVRTANERFPIEFSRALGNQLRRLRR